MIDKEKLRARATEVLDVLELDTRETNIEQMMVYLEAMSLFIQRNALYGDLWREYGPEDSLLHMRSKLARAEVTHGRSKGDDADISEAELVDSPLDLINYSVFYIRNVRGT